MAVLFSAVTMTADNNQEEFLVAGIPRRVDDLAGWTAYEDFMGELDTEQKVSVRVRAYLYGDGEIVQATPEEVAYFTMRAEANAGFLHDRCNNIENTDFIIEQQSEEENTMNEGNRLHRQAQWYKEAYPSGTRLVLFSMGNDPNPVKSRTKGTVKAVDDVGTLHCDFDNGRSLGIVPGEDSFRMLTDEELAEEQAVALGAAEDAPVMGM